MRRCSMETKHVLMLLAALTIVGLLVWLLMKKD